MVVSDHPHKAGRRQSLTPVSGSGDMSLDLERCVRLEDMFTQSIQGELIPFRDSSETAQYQTRDGPSGPRGQD